MPLPIGDLHAPHAGHVVFVAVALAALGDAAQSAPQTRGDGSLIDKPRSENRPLIGPDRSVKMLPLHQSLSRPPVCLLISGEQSNESPGLFYL